MERESVRELIIRLRDLILLEREQARQLDIEAMMATQEEKSAIIKLLSQVETLHPDDRKYAEEIHWENKRNAYLFRATLNWIAEIMDFFGRQTAPATYGQKGVTNSFAIGGRLLSGKI